MTKQPSISKEKILEIAGDYYVGYNPNYTLDTAIHTVGRRFNEYLQTQLTTNDMQNLMNGKNVIQCGGLDNYMVALFYKMQETKK